MVKLHLPLAVVTLAGLISPTLAAPVLHFKTAQDAATEQAPSQSPFAPGANSTKRGVPEGLPGFYDPATRTFKPLSAYAAPAGGPAYTGTVTVNLHVLSQSGEGIGPDDTVFCTVYVEFGNTAGSSSVLYFFVNHTAQKAVNFAAGEPVTAVQVPFSYTPNGNGAPYMQVSAICRISSDNGTSFVGNDTNPIQPIGSSTVPLDMAF